jgi:hypothetical protein
MKLGNRLKDQLVRSAYTLKQTIAPANSGTLFRNHLSLIVYNLSLVLHTNIRLIELSNKQLELLQLLQGQLYTRQNCYTRCGIMQ